MGLKRPTLTVPAVQGERGVTVPDVPDGVLYRTARRNRDGTYTLELRSVPERTRIEELEHRLDGLVAAMRGSADARIREIVEGDRAGPRTEGGGG